MARVSLENLGRSSLVGALAELWRIGSRFLLTPIVLAAIGLRGYGTWTLLFSVAAYISMANASFGVAYTKFTAECVRNGDYARLAGILGAGIAGVGAFAAVGLVAVGLLAGPILAGLHVPEEMRGDARIALVVIMAVLVARMTIGCTLEVLAGLQRVDLAHRLGIVASFVEFAVTVPLLLLGHGMIGMAAGYALGQIVSFALGWRWVKREDPAIVVTPLAATRAGLREVLAVGGRMQGLALANTFVLEGVKFLLSILIDPRATALYDLADKLINLGRALCFAVIAPLMAAFADLQAGAELARERELLVRGAKVVAVVSASAFGYLGVLAHPALLAWTGEDVALAAWALQILVVGELFTQQTGVASANLRARGLVRLEMTFAIVSTATLLVVLVPMAGIDPFAAVVWGRLVAQIVGATWYVAAFLRYVELPVRQWWTGSRFVAVIGVVGGTAGLVAVGRALAPALLLPISPRWNAAVEVALWSVPYAAILAVGIWRIVFDEDERARVRGLIGRKLWRS